MVEIEIESFPSGWAIVKFEDDDIPPWAMAGQFAIKEPTVDDTKKTEWWKHPFATEEDARKHAKTRLAAKESEKKRRSSS